MEENKENHLQDQKITEAIERYLDAVHENRSPSPDEFLRGYPEIANRLAGPIGRIGSMAQAAKQRADRQASSRIGRMKRALSCVVLLTVLLNAWVLWKWQSWETMSNALKVLECTPAQSDGNEPVRIVFDRPMVAPEKIGRVMPISGVRIDPPLKFEARWDSERAMMFRPLRKLPKATRFRMEIDSGLKSLDGKALHRPYSFEFQTPPLSVLSVLRQKRTQSGTFAFCITFNDEVQVPQLLTHLRLETPLRKNVPFVILSKRKAEEVEISLEASPEEKKLSLHIAKGLTGKSGPLPLGKEYKKSFVLDAYELTLESMEVESPAVGNPYIRLEFSDEMDPQRVESFLKIEPFLPCKFYPDYNGVKVEAKFKYGETYAIRLSRGMVSQNGWELKKEVVRNACFSDRSPFLRLAHSGRILTLHGQKSLAVESMNCSVANVGLYKIYPNNLLHFMRRGVWEYNAGEYGQPLVKRKIPIPHTPNEMARFNIALGELLPAEEKVGAYFFSLSNRDEEMYVDPDSRFILVTDLAITFKQQSDQELFCWITSLSEGKPVEGAQVSLWSRKNQIVAQSVTDSSGIARLQISSAAEEFTPFAIQALKGDDLSLLKFGQGAWNLSRFDVGGTQTGHDAYRAFLYSDRGVYRPGEEVRLVSLVRDRERSIPPSFPVRTSIHRSDGVEMFQVVSQTGSHGSVELSWPIPQDIRTGEYKAILALPGDKNRIGEYKFNVEEFVPDRFKLDISSDKEAYLAGEEVSLSFSAHHLHGAPASGQRLEIQVLLKGKDFRPGAFSDYSFGDNTRGFKPFSMPKGERELDGEGKTQFVFTVPTTLHPESSLSMVLQATLHEHSGRSTTRTKEIDVFPYPRYIGARKIGEEEVRPGSVVETHWVSVDAWGKIVPLEKATVRVLKYEWVWNLRRNGENAGYQYTRKEKECLREDLSFSEGKAVYRFTPDGYGEYAIFVEDLAGKMRTSLEISTWGGSVAQGEGAREYLELTADNKSFSPGETARVHLRSPIDGIALVSLEREKVMEYRTVSVVNGVADFSFQITPEHTPNVYCAATVVRPTGHSTEKRPLTRAYGILPLRVEQPRRLEVSISSPQRTRSRQIVEVEIQVDAPLEIVKIQDQKEVDAPAKRVPCAGAQVVLAAVDEGICQVTQFKTPDPFQFFYGKESLQTKAYDVYEQLLPDSPSGGSVVPSRSKTVIVQGARPLVIWKSGLFTDQKGKIKTSLDIPKYIGEVRIMAIAVKENCFGSSQFALQVSDPAVVQISSPRFAAWKDEFVVAASVRNQTGEKGAARIRLSCDPCFQVLGRTDYEREIENHQEIVFPFRVRCTGGIGQGKLHFEGSVGPETIEETIFLTVRPNVPKEERNQTGTISLGAPHTLSIPAPWHEGTGKVEFTLSASPDLKFGAGLDYLIRYPYGCLEQTTSRVFPLLYMKELLDVAEGKNASDAQKEKKAASFILAGIGRLSMMQTTSGGLGMWPGNNTPYPWGSAYAGHFLVEARKAGYPVPELLLEKTLDYLKSVLFRGHSGTQDREVQAYAAYVLACAGKISLADISHLSLEKASMTERCFIAATHGLLGKREMARDAFSKGARPATGEPETGGNLHSPVRDEAIYLSVLMDIQPEHSDVSQCVAGLLSSSFEGRWGNTQENAYALMALGKYFARVKKEMATQWSGTVREQGQAILSFDEGKPLSLVLERNQDVSLELDTQGHGHLFYRFVSKGVPLRPETKPLEKGIKVGISLLDARGNPLSKEVPCPIGHGELIWVEIELQGRGAYRNIVVDCALPTGFEAENPRLANVDRVNFLEKKRLEPEYLDIRDDRIELFVDLPDTQKHRVYWAARAISEGSFQWPPVRVFSMYHPGIEGRSEAMSIEVK